MTRQDEIRARLDVLPWASWATVDKDDLRWLLAAVEIAHLDEPERPVDVLARVLDYDAHTRVLAARVERAEAKVARVEALADEWDRLSKGESGTTAAIRKALAEAGAGDRA